MSERNFGEGNAKYSEENTVKIIVENIEKLEWLVAKRQEEQTQQLKQEISLQFHWKAGPQEKGSGNRTIIGQREIRNGLRQEGEEKVQDCRKE